MALTRPGKVVVGLLATIVLVGGGLFAYSKITGNEIPGIGGGGPGPVETLPVPSACPLTGLQADVPNRPALVVKIENAPASRPQAGLDKADVVYEQLVEGGITRFIAVFQCQDADRLGPVRSVRLVDPDIASQFGPSQPLFAHSGGIPEIVEGITRVGLLDIGFDKHPTSYHRDVARDAPHDLYSSTAELYQAGEDPAGVPASVFQYDPRVAAGARPATVVNVDFPNQVTNVFWRWDEPSGTYKRFDSDTPHTLEGGGQIQAKNVIIQYVQRRPTGFTDPNGTVVEEDAAIGQGDAIVFRNGQAVEGRWIRDFPEDVTQFVEGPNGQPIALAAGNTWVILVPQVSTTVTYE